MTQTSSFRPARPSPASKALRAAALAPALALGACAGDLAEFNREPIMSPVGSGLVRERQAYPVSYQGEQRDRARSFNSLYSNRSEDLFRDTRAMKIGDVVTVRININDKAKLDNNTDRSRNAAANFGFDFTAGLRGNRTNADLDSQISSLTSSRGRGLTDRSEEVELSVAAVVTEILPNGNLLISGSQEVRVNYDMRVLNIAGVVRPRDITGNNVVAYDKIAEARISYGGRGRGMEVLQPGWGQQVYDRVVPF